MKFKRFMMLAALLVSSVAAMVAQEMQMPPIPIDKNVKIGKLDNGMTYYIRKNNWPENVANFYIAQRVGSIQENEDQRGLAHFLEHMAFNGSEHFPDSALLDFTRRIGVDFGRDLNAYTSIDQTVYRICDVPTKRVTALDSCILVLKDWSNGLTLKGEEIEKERGVIHQEWQLGEGPTQRIIQKLLPRLYPGSKYGERLPIGLMSVVDGCNPQVLRDYYHKWYRPDNQAIIIVGDVDVDHCEQVIKDLWKNSKVDPNAAKVVDEPVPDNAEAIYAIEKDKEMQYGQILVFMKHDATKPEEKVGIDYLIQDYCIDLISLMFDMRTQEAAQKPDCPFVYASASYGEYLLSKTKEAFQLAGVPKEGKDLETLAAIYREAQRVKQYGFTPSEFDRAKEEYMSRLEKQYTNRNKIKNSEFGDQYRDHFLANEPIPSIEEYYEIMKQMAPMIPLEAVNQALQQELISNNDSNLVVAFFAPDREGYALPTEKQMAEAINAVRTEKIEPYVDNVKNEPLIAPEAMPKAGKIAKETENKELGYKELTLSNGARVILKKTDFKDDEIQFQAMAKGGNGLYGKADYDNLQLFSTIMQTSGLGNFSNTELQKALYGKQAAVSMSMNNYYQVLGGQTVPKDIETLMQLIYLNFTNVKKDEEAYKSIMGQIEVVLKNRNLSPETAFSDSVAVTIYNHERRFAPLTVETLKGVNQDRIMQMAKERFSNAGEFVFYFVGNFDEATLRPLIEQYIASLPSQKKATGWKEVPSFVKGKVQNKFNRKMESPKASAYEAWHMPVAYTAENEVLVDAAGQVLTMVYLKDIREDASAAYSVSAQGGIRRLGDNTIALMQAQCPMDPKKADTALKLLAKGMADNSQRVDDEKVQKVKETMLKTYDEQVKTNGFWMNYIDEYVWTGKNLVKGQREAIESLTPQKIAAFLKKLVASGNHVEVIMLPEENKQ